MFLYLFYMCCVLLPLINYNNVLGKRAPLERFLIEEGSKPAIFGSYSYDPVKQIFEPPPHDVNETETIPSQFVNNSYLSTAVEYMSTPANEISTLMNDSHHHLIFRKHVTVSTRKATTWWFRQKSTANNITGMSKVVQNVANKLVKNKEVAIESFLSHNKE